MTNIDGLTRVLKDHKVELEEGMVFQRLVFLAPMRKGNKKKRAMSIYL